MQEDRKVGVVLFQLGGPDSLEAVEPFLYNLFVDPDIIDFPLAKLARPALAKLISVARAKKVREHYAEIGGKSPIVELTMLQARALERELRESVTARVTVAMRYWHPFTEEAISSLQSFGCTDIVLLPLYPQFSKTTTGSSINEWRRRFRPDSFPGIEVKTVEEYYQHPLYLEAFVEKINAILPKFAEPERVHFIFSAHSVPKAVIDSGDPYQKQIEETVRLVLNRGGWGNPHRVCYQSKVGSDRWLEPSIHEVVEQLPREGARDVLVVPISFVSDHIETLSEIDREVREEAAHAGIRQFEMTPGLNDAPMFISALADLVLRAVGIASSTAVPVQ